MVVNDGMLRLFQFRKQLSCDQNALSKIILVNITSSIQIGLSLFMAVYSGWKGEWVFPVIFAVFAVLSLVSILLANYSARLLFAIYLSVFVAAFLFITMGIYRPGSLCFIGGIFPLISLFILGNKRGFLFSVSFIIIHLRHFSQAVHHVD